MPINRTGYSSNQFLNIEKIESSSNPTARTNLDNPDFLYPGTYYPNVYDDLKNGPLGRLPVQRGFIRGIFPEIIKRTGEAYKNKNSTLADKYNGIDPPIRRCFFQFNPSLILRSVQASSSTLNPLLQDPSQLLQAIPGQASFEFQLLFNREREVAGQVYKDGNGSTVPTTPLTQLLDNYGSGPVTDSKNPENNRDSLLFNQNQVGDLGVLVDLYVLDSIIGQSITDDTVQTIRAYWEASKNLRNTGELDSDGKPINPYADAKFFDPNHKSTSGLTSVLGNSAFLNPMPVRIVFSSLFMVEGFVTASSVAFHKFSENMVPTVCQVTLSVQALYIGFARKNSYISEQLEKQITQDIDVSIKDEAASKTAKSALLSSAFGKLANMGFSMAGWKDGLTTYINEQPSYTLNTWWKEIYDCNNSKHYADPEGYPNVVRYTLSQAVNTESLRFYTDDSFKGLVNNKAAITKLEVTDLKLYFYDADDLPAWATDSEIVKVSNKGKLSGGNYKGLTYIAKCRVNVLSSTWTLLKTNGNDYNKNSLADSLESKKLIEGTKKKPYETKWITDDMGGYGFDDKRITANSSKYFGDNVKILAQLTLTATFSSEGANGDITVPVIKSVVRDFDPNQEIAASNTFGLDFDFIKVADDTGA